MSNVSALEFYLERAARHEPKARPQRSIACENIVAGSRRHGLNSLKKGTGIAKICELPSKSGRESFRTDIRAALDDRRTPLNEIANPRARISREGSSRAADGSVCGVPDDGEAVLIVPGCTAEIGVDPARAEFRRR